ncbi:MAG TPA: WG repeat-containing protein [Bacteroidota bacterium]
MKSARFLFSLLILLGCSKSGNVKTGQGSATNRELPLELFREGNLAGYRDLGGQVAIKPQYVEAGDFSWGLARVKPDAKRGWGYIDASGTEIIQPQYEAAGDFADGMTVVLSKGQFVYIGPDGSSLGMFEEDHPAKPLVAGDTLYVVHPNGLIVRASGDINAAPVCQVPPDGAVQVASDAHAGPTATPDGLLGNWLFVRYHGKSGYLIDLYLSRYPQSREHQPVERYRLVGSSLNNDQYSTYTLIKFATGGCTIEHAGPNWTEDREIVPDATVDQVVARLKLYPAGATGSLLAAFNGISRTFVTQTGDSLSTTLRRDTEGFLNNLTVSKKNDIASIDITINGNPTGGVEIVTTSSTQPTDSGQEPSNPL